MALKTRYADVVLGFPESATCETNEPQNFASKAGGLPVWLYRAPSTPPSPPKCGICNQGQKFLLQLYAPLETDVIGHEDAFHRMIYVAICSNGGCQKRNTCVSVLRAQLPRRNDYYSYDGGGEFIEEVEEAVCVLCGFLASCRCGGCQSVAYCGKACQSRDWKLGHRDECRRKGSDDVEDSEQMRSKWRFQEVEIVTDRHPTPPTSDSDGEGDFDECEESEDGKAEAKEKNPDVKGTFQDANEDELPEDMFEPRKGRMKDAVYDKFCHVISYAKEQVIRYDRGGKELWGSRENQCESIGPCARCGGKRVFEFQIMPQLVYFVAPAEKQGASIQRVAERLRDDMDWITIAVYTCERSCSEGEEYVAEAAWLQSSH